MVVKIRAGGCGERMVRGRGMGEGWGAEWADLAREKLSFVFLAACSAAKMVARALLQLGMSREGRWLM